MLLTAAFLVELGSQGAQAGLELCVAQAGLGLLILLAPPAQC